MEKTITVRIRHDGPIFESNLFKIVQEIRSIIRNNTPTKSKIDSIIIGYD